MKEIWKSERETNDVEGGKQKEIRKECDKKKGRGGKKRMRKVRMAIKHPKMDHIIISVILMTRESN